LEAGILGLSRGHRRSDLIHKEKKKTRETGTDMITGYGAIAGSGAIDLEVRPRRPLTQRRE
jgi:hypothetical protein